MLETQIYVLFSILTKIALSVSQSCGEQMRRQREVMKEQSDLELVLGP